MRVVSRPARPTEMFDVPTRRAPRQSWNRTALAPAGTATLTGKPLRRAVRSEKRRASDMLPILSTGFFGVTTGGPTTGGVVPLPTSAPVWGPGVAVLDTTRLPERWPDADGVIATLTVQVWPPVSVPPAVQVPPGTIAKSPELAPPIVRPLIVAGTLLSLET